MATPIASDKVSSIIDNTTNWAKDIVALAKEAIDNLGQFDYPVIQYGTINPPYVDIKSLAPSNMDSLPADPSKPSLFAVKEVTFPAEPKIDVPSSPSITKPNVPPAPSISTPTMATAQLATLLGINIPTAPALTLKEFNIAPPVPISINPATFNIVAEEINFADGLFVPIQKRLMDNIDKGGSGLLPAIEEAIWDRDKERNEQTLSDSTDKEAKMWAKKGFSLPDGMLAHSLSELQREYANRRIDTSRLIAVEQAKLEQANIFKSMELGNQLFLGVKEILVKYKDLRVRCLESTAKFFNEYIDLQIKAHNDAIEVYKATVMAYESQVRAQLAQVEIFKAQIEGEMSKAKVNEQLVNVYSAEITANIAEYKGVIDGNRSIVEMFTAQVQAVLAEAQVNESTIKAYAESVRAALAKAEIYKALCSTVESEAKIGVSTAEVNIENIRAWATTVEVNAEKYKAEVEKYKAENAYNVSSAEIAARVAEINSNLFLGTAKLVEMYNELNVKGVQAAADAKMKGLESLAMVTGNMAAGAMSAISAHSSLGYSETMSLTPGQ